MSRRRLHRIAAFSFVYPFVVPIIVAYDGFLRWSSVLMNPASSSIFFSSSGE